MKLLFSYGELCFHLEIEVATLSTILQIALWLIANWMNW